MDEESRVRRGSRLPGAVALLSLFTLAACASTPPAPTASLNAAKQAIARAESADVDRYAATELNEARIKLAAADAAVRERRMVMAERFAQASRAEAELAVAKSAAAKAIGVNTEMRRNIGALVAEVHRVQPPGSTELRGRLTRLQADPNLCNRALRAIEEADVAVQEAEQPQADAPLAQHRVYMADLKIEMARALAESRFAEDEHPALSEQQKLAHDQTRGAADASAAATSFGREAAEWQRQIDELNATPTYRGWVVTLGDVLFASEQADLAEGISGSLDKLVTFLEKHPSRTVVIEGYTDSAGSELYNQELSQRRADSVRTYLVERGIHPIRLVAAGMGESAPLAGNESATGRQRNRRVEMTINNLPAAALR
jgi:outer membrane protein OmpA-like peptidoglycan-associated protein